MYGQEQTSNCAAVTGSGAPGASSDSVIERLRRANRTVDRLVKCSLDPENDLDALLRECTEALCNTLEIERSGVWFYNDDRTELIAADIYLRSQGEHSDGAVLEARMYPAYFEAIATQRAVVAHDARTDARTREFTDGYLVPLDIHSMLDAPIRSEIGPRGVICCETVGSAKHWSEDEVTFAGAVADLLSLAVEGHRLRVAKERISQLAHFDELTGLGNRALFREYLDAVPDETAEAGEPLHLFLVDLDRFKTVNDQYGHEVGDEILALAGERLREASTEAPNRAAFRLGGDEFAFIVKGPNETEARELGQQLALAVAQPYAVRNMELEVGASVGCASLPCLVDNPGDLIKAADLALYSVKRSRIGAFAYFDEQLKSSALARQLLEADLIDAIHRKDFQIYVQPIVNARDGCVLAAELLLRWYNRRLGAFIPPDTFIPMAEAQGLIPLIDRYVFTSALDLIRSWNARGIDCPELSVNISPETFISRKLFPVLDTMLDDPSLPVEKITIEVTEGIEILNEEDMSRIFRKIRSLGFKIYIDDFGSGHTGLSYFTTIPVDGVKIDKSLTCKLLTCEKTKLVVSSIVNLARDMKLDIVIEGIETPEQQDVLRAYGDLKLQGFYFGQPVPVEEFESSLAQKERSCSLTA